MIKSHEEFKEGVLSGQRLREFMTNYSESRNTTIYEVRKQADSYLDEIAAKYSHTFVSWASKPVDWLLKTMYDGMVVDEEGLQAVKTMSQKGPLVLVPCHKKPHGLPDPILSLLHLQHAGPPIPQPVKTSPSGPWVHCSGPAGAFFVRRTFSGAVVYAKVFSEYISKLLEEGFNIELFIEGGRSRSGKLLMPKLGFLMLLFNAFKNNVCDDMIFVPVYIGYDQVLEETAYLQEVTGGKKEPENISQILQARRFPQAPLRQDLHQFPKSHFVQRNARRHGHKLRADAVQRAKRPLPKPGLADYQFHR